MNGKSSILSGSVYRSLLSITMPIMIMNVMQSLINVLDMTILAKYTNDIAVGAVGACSFLFSLCTGLVIGIASGANIVVAKCIGKGNVEQTKRAIGCAILFSLISGIVLAIIGVCCAEIFLKWTNCPDELLESATIYFRIYFAGVPFLVFYNFCASILRAAGDTKRPMYYLTLTGVIKILLSLFFILAFNLSVAAVGLATVISFAIAGILCFIAITKHKDMIHFEAKYLRFYAAETKEMIFIGIPTGIQSSLYSLANTIIASAVNRFGPYATTGLSIANQYDGILYQIVLAPSLAIVPYVAQNIGANNINRAMEASKKGVIITIAFGATLGAFSAIFSRQLTMIMSTTPEVIMYSQQKMVIVSSTYFICGINEVVSGVLRGVGKPIVPTVSAFFFMCILRILWVYFVFPFYPTLTSLYLVWPIGWVLCIIVGLIFLLPKIKDMRKESIHSHNLLHMHNLKMK